MKATDLLANVNDLMSRRCKNYTSLLVKLARMDGKVTIVTTTKDFADHLKKTEKVNAVSISTNFVGVKDNLFILDNSVIEAMTSSFKDEIEEHTKLIERQRQTLINERQQHANNISNLNKIITRQAETINESLLESRRLVDSGEHYRHVLSNIHDLSLLSILKLKLLKWLCKDDKYLDYLNCKLNINITKIYPKDREKGK